MPPLTQPFHSSLPRSIRCFSATTSRAQPSSFLDLQARSVSRENGHFTKLSGGNYMHHSPALELLRSEADLAEGKTMKKPASKASPIATSSVFVDAAKQRMDEQVMLTEEYKRQNEALKTQLVAKEQAWRDRYASESKEWGVLEERSLRLRLLFGMSLLVSGLLAADGVMLAREVDQHCPGCFEGNTKEHLFLVPWVTGGVDMLRGRLGHREDISRKMKTNIGKAKSGISLPAGWEQGTTPDGRTYFVDWNTSSATFVDPRMSRSSSKATRTVLAKQEKVVTAAIPVQKTVMIARPASRRSEEYSWWQKLMWASPDAT